MNNILIAIPAYNESLTIAKVVKEALSVSKNVIVIDDGSTDNSALIAKDSGATVIINSTNKGYTNAIIKGFEYAIENKFTQIATLDGDGAHDPSDLINLLAIHNNSKCHLTIGDRFSSGAFEDVPHTKKWANYFATNLLNKIMKLNLNDVSCGLRVIEIELVNSILKKLSIRFFASGFSLVYDMLKIASEMKYKICQSAIKVNYDASELLCTKQLEFIDYLESLIKITSLDREINMTLVDIKNAVSRFDPITVMINGKYIYIYIP